MRVYFLLLGLGLSAFIIFDSQKKNKLILGYTFAFLSIINPLLGLVYFIFRPSQTISTPQTEPPESIICSKCGTLNSKNDTTCHSCGNTLSI